MIHSTRSSSFMQIFLKRCLPMSFFPRTARACSELTRIIPLFTIIHGLNQPCMVVGKLGMTQFDWINCSRPCVELYLGNGEPDIRERPFEELPGLEGFNHLYRVHGGPVNLKSEYTDDFRVAGLAMHQHHRLRLNRIYFNKANKSILQAWHK